MAGRRKKTDDQSKGATRGEQSSPGERVDLRPSAFDLRGKGGEKPQAGDDRDRKDRPQDIASPLPKPEEEKPAATGRMKSRKAAKPQTEAQSRTETKTEAKIPEGRRSKVEGRTRAEAPKVSESPKPRKRATAKVEGRIEVETVVENPQNPLVEELQNMGADVVPTVAISALREHTIDQVQPSVEKGDSILSDWDLYLFNEGSHHNLWEKLGSHVVERDGVVGTNFAVWAPNAERVSVIGDFNGWNPSSHRLEPRGHSGIWERWIPHVSKGTIYKYHISSRHNGYRVDKADPFAVHHETPPRTGSIVWDLDYEWNDVEWMKNRKSKNSFDSPMSIYEVHLGSWRHAIDGDRPRMMSYREVAEPLAHYARKMNYTHVELMPIMEHPFGGSWGYQCTGFFAPTSRHGTPQDFKYLVDVLHQNGIGVILDWVPSHFPTDEHGLAYFDGTHLFEHADPRKGFHPDWGSLIFNYGRNEVRSFLLSSALYWLGEYHADGLRVDAVASMLYLDYSRKHGEWIPNEFGGRENIDAISFLRRLNEDVYKVHPDVQVIAEESTAWPMVSRPTYVGGLGFGMKWDMGWMHDTLRYFAHEPVHRKYHHNDLTFRMMYAFTENFVLPLSHDEVVHGKGSLLGKMPGDDWQKLANLRLLFGYQWSLPGKKLLFMGGEFGAWKEWSHEGVLDWSLCDHDRHAGVSRWVRDLNAMYRRYPALYRRDCEPGGFEWIIGDDRDNSVLVYARRGADGDPPVVIACNFTPVPRHEYIVGVPSAGRWSEILNSDAKDYGGSGLGNLGVVEAAPEPWRHMPAWTALTLPPLGCVYLVRE